MQDQHVVYVNEIVDKIVPGSSFLFKGVILRTCERFSINFAKNNLEKNIALSLNPRWPENYIVRNCKIDGKWGIEEVTSILKFSLEREHRFAIQFVVTANEFYISINGQHFASFRHRLSYSTIDIVQVKGDVADITMEQRIVLDYPDALDFLPHVIDNISSEIRLHDALNIDESLDMPYYGRLEHPFRNGCELNIKGRVKLLPHSFCVNLQEGMTIWPHPGIPFHFNPRFVGGTHIIVCNSWGDDKWNREEIIQSTTDFFPGREFLLAIKSTDTSYKVRLNNKKIAEYTFQTTNYKVNMIYIQGDIHLHNVWLRNCDSVKILMFNDKFAIEDDYFENDRDDFAMYEDDYGIYDDLIDDQEQTIAITRKDDVLCINKDLTKIPHEDSVIFHEMALTMRKPIVVYINNNLSNVVPGSSFLFKGVILRRCERFSISFAKDNLKKNIALFFKPRMPQNYVIRNCKINGVWGAEELISPLKFNLHRDKQFAIQFLVTENEFYVSINGRHYASFRHRLPYHMINMVLVKGDVSEITMEQSNTQEYPNPLDFCPHTIQNITDNRLSFVLNHAELVPYYGTLQQEFRNGCVLNIKGRVKLLPHSFFINLQQGKQIWPHPGIPFQFSPRFQDDGKKHLIVCNTWYNGKWGRQHITNMSSEFLPGKEFQLRIKPDDVAYVVSLNKEKIVDYKFRFTTYKVNTIYIQGDIHLYNIWITHEEKCKRIQLKSAKRSKK